MEQRSVKGVGYFAANGFKVSGGYALNAFTTRIGGVSDAPFNTLDFSGGIESGLLETGLKARADNLSCLGTALGVERLKCALVKQVHGDTVLRLDSAKAQSLERTAKTEADAIVTAIPDVAIGVLTADCLPILLYDPVTGTVAAVHAGWRGTFLSIVKKTIAVMVKEYGVRPFDLRAALGPCIGLCCYAVSGDFYEKFLTSFGSSINDSFRFSTGASGQASGSSISDEGHALGKTENGNSVAFDLQGANTAQLLEAGVLVERIESVSECTACRPDLFFSYRRDVIAGRLSGDIAGGATEQMQTGRMLSLVIASLPAERTEP